MPRSSKCLFPSGFSTKNLYAPLLSHILATFPTHLILLDLITQLIFGEQYISLGSSLFSTLHSPVTSFLLLLLLQQQLLLLLIIIIICIITYVCVTGKQAFRRTIYSPCYSSLPIINFAAQ
jgi:hypothetical protein